jgi:hypothetical protein
MEATCNNCNHWEQDQNKIQLQSKDFGLCDELTGQHALEPSYVLPLVHQESKDLKPKQFEMITGSSFGCNHFTERKRWV